MSLVARNIFSLVSSKIFASVLIFVAYASLFRYLGTEATGKYQFILSYVMLFSIIVDFGIQQLVIKKVSEDKSQAQRYLGNFFAVEFGLAIAVYAILSVIAYYNNYEPMVFYGILLAGFGMMLNAFSIPLKSVISGFEAMHKIAVVNFFDSVINAAVIFLAIIFSKNILFLSSVQVFMGIMHMIVYGILIRKYVPDAKLFGYIKSLDFSLVKSMLMAALPFGMLIGFSIVYNKIDIIILTKIRGYAETGLYTAAYKFFDLLAFVPAVVASSLYPFFANQIQLNNTEQVKNALQNYTKYMIALALPLAFGGALLARKLITVVGGVEFIEGYAALQILVFASAMLFIYATASSLMISQLTKYAALITFINIFVNAIGNLLLIPHYGFKAAAIMTLVSESIQGVFYFYFVRKKIIDFTVFKSIPKPLLAAVLMTIVLWPIREMTLFITIPVGILVYSAAIFITGFISKQDLLLVRNLLARGNYEEK